MSILSDFVAPIIGKKSSAEQAQDEQAQANLEQAKQAFGSVALPEFSPVDLKGPNAVGPAGQAEANISQAQAVAAGPSAMNQISTNPAYTAQAQAQMAALSNLAANGGRNAASDANLAAIEQEENANAKGQRDAILQNMNARGMGGSGASLLAQLSSSQNATNNQSARDLGIAGQQANTALGAGSQAAQLGMGLQNQEFSQASQVAAANDAINKFNAQNATGMNQFNAGAQNQGAEFNAGQGNQLAEFNTNLAQNNANSAANAYNQNQTTNKIQIPQQQFGNAIQKAGGLSGVNMGGVNYFNNQGSIASQAQGNALGTFGKLGAAAMAAAEGGRIPGIPAVPGDSPLNDFVPMKTSPGEVVVPRSLAMGGTPHEIGHFVKHAPTVHMPGQHRPYSLDPAKDKEAMLSALKHMHHR